MDKFKRYTVIDNHSGDKYYYSHLGWNFAWTIVFIGGILIGYCYG